MVEGVMMWSIIEGEAAKMAAPLSRTNWVISEERPGYFVVVASMSAKYSMRTEKPWYMNHARVDVARGR